MVGSRQARTEERRPFPGAAQKVRADYLPGQGSRSAGPFAGGIPRRQRIEGPLDRRQQILKNLSDLDDKAAAAKEVMPPLNTEIGTHQRTQPAVALEAIFVRDEIREAAASRQPLRANFRPHIWSQEARKWAPFWRRCRRQTSPRAAIFQGGQSRTLDGARSRHPQPGFRQAGAAKWPRRSSPGAKLDRFKEILARLISQHQASSELLLWLAKERSDSFADILGPEVFRAMLTAMERDQFNEKRSNKLRDFILDDQNPPRRTDRFRRSRSHQGPDPRPATFALFRRHGQTVACWRASSRAIPPCKP